MTPGLRMMPICGSTSIGVLTFKFKVITPIPDALSNFHKFIWKLCSSILLQLGK